MPGEEPCGQLSSQGSNFVGRRAEVAALTSAFEATLAGQGQLVMLVGEPGIGKTRTSQELAGKAVQQGAQVLWGHCYEQPGMPSYWPWMQIIRSHLQKTTPEQLQAEMGSGAADIAEIIPEVRVKLPHLEPPPTTEPDQARFRLFDSVTTFLKNASQIQPLVLIMDNLHWADKASLLLLEFLGQGLEGCQLLVLGTYRDVGLSRRHPLSETLGELNRQQYFHAIPLKGLGAEDIGLLIQNTTGIVPSQEFVEAVHSHTEGNPLFVVEVMSMLAQEGTLTAGQMGKGDPPGHFLPTNQIEGRQSWATRIPDGIRQVIGRRLNHLSEGCNRVLTIASVVGREFHFDHLARLLDEVSEDQLVEVLEEALGAKVVEELPGPVGHYQFTHSLIQYAIADEISTVRRVRLHGRIAQALESLYGPDSVEHAAELAHHFASAATAMGTEKLVRYSLLAGERALATYAYEEALGHFRRAMAAKEGQPRDSETIASLFGLGRAQGAIGNFHEAWSNLGLAFDHCVELGEVAQAIAVAEYPLFYVAGVNQITRLVSRALTLVPPDSHEAGRLLCRYGLLLNLETANYQGAQEALEQALAIAQREGDAALEIRALANAADVDFYHLRWHDVLGKSVGAIELARRTNDPYAQLWPLYLAASASWALGDSQQMAQHAAAMLDHAETLRDRGFLANALVLSSGTAHMKGDWPAARDFSDRALSISPHWFWPLACRALMECETGELALGESYLERLLEEIRRFPPLPTAEVAYAVLAPALVARFTGDFSRFDDAQTAAQTVLSSPAVTPRIAWDVHLGLALIAAELKDIPAATEQYLALEPTRGTALLHTSVDRVLGLLAATTGQLDQAITHFEDALAFCGEAGYRPEYARTCYDYAGALLQRQAPGDRERVVSLLEESSNIAIELGMRPLMEHSAALKERAGSRPARAPAYPDGLSEREVEVLRLIAAGKSNREIAQELFISDRTVAQHVTSILNKTGAANRTEAAIYATRHGLVS